MLENPGLPVDPQNAGNGLPTNPQNGGGDKGNIPNPENADIQKMIEDTFSKLVNPIIEKNTELYNRTKRAEEALKANQPSNPQPQPQGQPQYATQADLDKVELRRLGHSEAAISFIETYAKGAGKRTLDVLGEAPVLAGVAPLNQANASKNATPSPSGNVVPLPTGRTTASEEFKKMMSDPNIPEAKKAEARLNRFTEIVGGKR